MRFLFILLISLFILKCQSTSPTEPLLGKIDENIDIPFGRTVHIADNGFDITFLDVSDGRCIYNGITCVWFGNAVVAFRIDGEDVSLNTATADSYPSEILIGDFMISLLSLSPHQTDTWPVQKKQYVATIRVSK